MHPKAQAGAENCANALSHNVFTLREDWRQVRSGQAWRTLTNGDDEVGGSVRDSERPRPGVAPARRTVMTRLHALHSHIVGMICPASID